MSRSSRACESLFLSCHTQRNKLTQNSYFCREYIEGYYLASETHRKFIDVDVLEKYSDVGGVRIEDCLLVTEDGYENLTTAPKGDELLDVINGGFQHV